MRNVKDTITASAPGFSANHTIEFTASSTIPVSGQIVITPEAGYFTIPSGLDYTDIDLAQDGTELTLASVPGSGAGSAVGVSVTSGTSGNITFTLNDADAIAASSSVRVRVGTHAATGTTGDKQITNPSAVNSYKIGIVTKDSGGTALDEGSAMIAVVERVSISGSNATSTEEEETTSTPTPSIIVPDGGHGSFPSAPKKQEEKKETEVAPPVSGVGEKEAPGIIERAKEIIERVKEKIEGRKEEEKKETTEEIKEVREEKEEIMPPSAVEARGLFTLLLFLVFCVIYLSYKIRKKKI